ncbi:hypothetical protein [Mycobacteroides abscessus]|uniref:hypothetical protein n=1 Tax=Mycobacteroides abscessus TaxID=36809 RepID=UPI0005E799FC|nr:hypothetical protein [Mycobacteroides abscessus]SIN08522.1 Uncharacterised protein [Mycobacteroides abscessus subsp. abscessus]MBN7538126.1 hypothetical protein [Mycobacteroides abscessus subsp. massiliense]MDB2308267.1 hypothetical protein [Mycobacteroides abscessus subsp. massiliense]MDM2165168.1 hypothetical protein [Mycobacteroides abscessus]MDO2975614.1 hypothetical protein [Mycobacteroides abscessus subsp. massiliense]
MTNCSKSQFAATNPSTRRDIALAVQCGISVEQLAEQSPRPSCLGWSGQLSAPSNRPSGQHAALRHYSLCGDPAHRRT